MDLIIGPYQYSCTAYGSSVGDGLRAVNAVVDLLARSSYMGGTSVVLDRAPPQNFGEHLELRLGDSDPAGTTR